MQQSVLAKYLIMESCICFCDNRLVLLYPGTHSHVCQPAFSIIRWNSPITRMKVYLVITNLIHIGHLLLYTYTLHHCSTRCMVVSHTPSRYTPLGSTHTHTPSLTTIILKAINTLNNHHLNKGSIILLSLVTY